MTRPAAPGPAPLSTTHAPSTRPLPAIALVRPADEDTLSPRALIELLAEPDTDPGQYELRSADVDPASPDHDPLADRLDGDPRWGLDLDDPYLWAA